MSGDGQTIAYLRASFSNNTNLYEIFVQDLPSGSNILASDGLHLDYFNFPISSNGSTIVFGDSLHNLYAFRADTRSNEPLSVAPEGTGSSQVWSTCHGISADGRFVLFDTYFGLVASDNNGFSDLYVRDLITGVTHLVSSDTNGIASGFTGFGADISSDGRWVAFGGFGPLLPVTCPWPARTFACEISSREQPGS